MSFSEATIVGGRGFIGRHLTHFLERKGLSVTVPMRDDRSWILRPKGLFIWAAGYTADFDVNPAATIRAHAADLADAIASGGYDALLYLSSTRLYDGMTGAVDEDTPLALDPVNPRHLYDLSKGLGEWIVRHRGGPTARVARLSGVYADSLDGGSFVEELVERALHGNGGAIDTAPDVARDYVYVEDVCAALWAMANHGRSDVYNVASGETIQNRVLLGLLSERTGTRLEPARRPSGASAPSVCIARMASELSVRPRSLVEGLDRVLTWQDNQRAMRSMMGVTRMPWM